jgi:hypothetical protein
MDDILNRLVEEDMPELTKISGASVRSFVRSQPVKH